MARRWLLLGFAAVSIFSSYGCASGDGVPEVTIRNEIEGCLLEASFLGYNFPYPIGNGGATISREVPAGKAEAYAIFGGTTSSMSGTCEQLVNDVELNNHDTMLYKVYRTNAAYEATAGATTVIRFTPDLASKITYESDATPEDDWMVASDCTKPEFVKPYGVFYRLQTFCASPPAATPTPGAGDAGTD